MLALLNLGSNSFDLGVFEANKIHVKTDETIKKSSNGLTTNLTRVLVTATSTLPTICQLASVSNLLIGITITLPVSLTGKVIYIKRLNNTSTGSITLRGSGTSLIEAATGAFGATTSLGTSATTRRAIFVFNGTDWELVIN